MEKNNGAAPTGCYKCGRPGHWSRDCTFSATNSAQVGSQGAQAYKNGGQGAQIYKNGGSKSTEKSSQNPKKLPRTRPKLTPELLLSNDGLGYVLRHFPRAFKYRGPGHEVNDLGNLIELYAQWHSHLLPYFSFKQFTQKVEQVGATKRVRTCIRELRDRVARGGDPTKLHEPPVEPVAPNNESGAEEEAMDVEGSMPDMAEPPLDCHDADEIQEEMFDEIYRQSIEDPCQSSQNQTINSAGAEMPPQRSNSLEKTPIQTEEDESGSSVKLRITEEQKARMEANRLKALEKAAARSRSTLAA